MPAAQQEQLGQITMAVIAAPVAWELAPEAGLWFAVRYPATTTALMVVGAAAAEAPVYMNSAQINALVPTVPRLAAAGRTNAQLVEEIATRAEAWGLRNGLPAAGGGPVQGTLKHSYAAALLERYQQMFGNRGLLVEKSYIGGQQVPYGTPGSVRLDVFDEGWWAGATRKVFDYKFTRQQPPTIPLPRQQRILQEAPAGTQGVTAVGP